MDLGLLFGFIVTWIIILVSILLGGQLMIFYDLPSVVLVVLGSVTILFMVVPAAAVKNLFPVIKKALFPEKFSEEEVIREMVRYALIARRDGVLSLERVMSSIHDPFTKRGLQMVVDGSPPEVIDQVLSGEIENLAGRHEANKALFDTLGKYAPAMGMIGTLIGLVIMLQNMDDPQKIGPGMAVAILTTLYGALISNAICLPIADRLAKRSGDEQAIRMLVMKGLLSLQAGENPRVVEMKLRSVLPSKNTASFGSDGGGGADVAGSIGKGDKKPDDKAAKKAA